MKYNFFFRILQWIGLISKLSQTQFDGPLRCQDAFPTFSSLSVNHCFGSPITSRSLGKDFFRIQW